MNMPELFLKRNKFSKGGSADIIKKYFHLLRVSEDERCTVLDIGSGPGNITHDALLPSFKNSIEKIVGSDVTNEMVDYANTHYGSDKLTFELFDIEREVPKHYVSYFDYVVSFLTLQWVKDQRQLYANIQKIVKPNGQLLLCYIAQSTLYNIYSKIWTKPEYAPFITDAQRGISCFQKSADPKRELKAILEQAGFEVCMIKTEEVELNDANMENLKDFLISVDPMYNHIPDHLKDQFMDDYMSEVGRKPDSNNFYVTHNLFVVYARKK